MEKKCFLLLVLLLTARLFALDLEYKVVKDSAKCEVEVMNADLNVQFANKNIKSFKVRAGEKSNMILLPISIILYNIERVIILLMLLAAY